MRTSFAAFLVALALVAAGEAGAKGTPPYAVGICGPTGCAAVVAVSNWNQPAWLSDRSLRAGAAAPAPFYAIGMLYSNPAMTTSPVAYYVPSAGVLKLKGSVVGSGEATWLHVEPDVAALLERAAQGLRPFARPRVSWAMVGNRWVKKPASYARLYLLRGPPAADPAGPPPAPQYQTPDREAWFAVWAPYLERVQAEWVRVQIGTRAASPWDVLETFVWVGRHSDLLRRDGEVIQIPAFVADLIRGGAPL